MDWHTRVPRDTCRRRLVCWTKRTANRYLALLRKVEKNEHPTGPVYTGATDAIPLIIRISTELVKVTLKQHFRN